MKLPASPRRTLKHERVSAELRQEIAEGKYQPGQKLPSEAALVRRFGASRITVGRAVSDLRREGLVERRAGSGSYVRAVAAAMSANVSFGLLIPDLGQTEIFEPICQGMSEAPQTREHALLWFQGMPREGGIARQEQAWQICQQCIRRRVDGVFFAPFETVSPGDRTNHRIVAALEEAGIPIVLLDREYLPYPHRSRHDLVGIDNRRTGALATEHLVSLGARRIGFLSLTRGTSTIEERIAGYRETLFRHALPVEPGLIRQLSLEEMGAVLSEQRPDAFLCANDRTAARLMQRLLELGVRVPDDVRIVGIDDAPVASLLPVPLTTMQQPCREIGHAAIHAMFERLDRPGMATRDILLACPLIVRQSSGPPQAAPAHDSTNGKGKQAE